MLEDLLIAEEFVEPGKAAGEIYEDQALGEEEPPEPGALVARWEAVIEMRAGEKTITFLTIRGPDGAELPQEKA
jgi:hypothetical protein